MADNPVAVQDPPLSGEGPQLVEFDIANLPDIGSLAEQWRALEAESSFFLSWNWVGTWLATLPAEFEPLLLSARCRGEALGMAIAVRRRARRHWLVKTRQLHLNSTGDPGFDGITIEHNGFVGLREFPAHFLRWFSRADLGAEEIVVPGLSLVPPDPGALLCAAYETPAFRLSDLERVARDGIGAKLSANARQQLNRSIRDLSALGPLRLQEASTPEEGLVWFEQLKALHIESWTRRGKRHAFEHPYFEVFHRALISRAVPGSVQLLRISAGEHAIGYLYNFVHGSTTYTYQSGFDDRDPKLRPGYVCHALAIADAAGQGAMRYDFLAGDNRLKRSFANERYAMRWLRFSRPSAMLRLERLGRIAFKRRR